MFPSYSHINERITLLNTFLIQTLRDSFKNERKFDDNSRKITRESELIW